MTTQKIMLVIGDADWTVNAIHLACTIARREGRELVIVKMLPMQHTGWLGAPQDFTALTRDERHLLSNCLSTADDYGVTATSEFFQYVDLPEAIRQAAEHYEASTVFAMLPHYRLAFWGKLMNNQLERQLHQQHCTLHTLAPSNAQGDWTPSVVVTPH